MLTDDQKSLIAAFTRTGVASQAMLQKKSANWRAILTSLVDAGLVEGYGECWALTQEGWDSIPATKYYLGAGTVQPVVGRDSPFFLFHFGRAEYQRDLPIVTDSIRTQAQPIVDALNAGTITQDEAIEKLKAIYW